MSKAHLLEHQRTGIEWIQRVGRGLLADEPGLGKTRIAIEAFDGGHNIVVAPKLVIDGGTWRDELEKWSKDPSKWTVVPYSQLNMRKATEADPKKGLKGGGYSPVNALREEYRGHWDALVLDEAHYIKGRNSSWTWAANHISRSSDATLAMTGTPIPNWAHELFTVLKAINPEEGRIGKKYGSFWRWAEAWFDTSPTRFSGGNPVVGELLGCIRGGKEGFKRCMARPANDPCQHYVEFTKSNLGDQYLRRWREDCLDLPECTTQQVEIPMSVAQGRLYRELKKDFASSYEDQEVVAWSQGTLNVMLDRITTSPWLLNPTGVPKDGKFDRLKFDLESRSRPTLVLAHYRETVEACAKLATHIGARTKFIHGGTTGDARGRAVAEFQAGKLDVLVGSLETISEGLTLTAADMAIFVETSFKPSRNEQATFRIYRLGQTRPVTILDYVTPKTVDSKKRRLLATKTDRQMRFMTAAEYKELL